jgi:hypothetical protein
MDRFIYPPGILLGVCWQLRSHYARRCPGRLAVAANRRRAANIPLRG